MFLKTRNTPVFILEPNLIKEIYPVLSELADKFTIFKINLWDFKLLIFDFFFLIYLGNCQFFIWLTSVIYPFFFQSFWLINWSSFLSFPFNSSIFFGLKFCFCISFLILIRGGTPRYRYDYLTKLGWLKFLSLILLVFSFSLLFYILF